MQCTVGKEERKNARQSASTPIAMNKHPATSLVARLCAYSAWPHRPTAKMPTATITRMTRSSVTRRVLALTKVNWNSTQFDQKLPAPIKAAREVGRILKHVEFQAAVSPDFRKYT
jgi:hypothetical protein